MDRKIVDPDFFIELDKLCDRYSLRYFDTDYDQNNQLILYTGLMCKEGENEYVVMTTEDYSNGEEKSDD